MVIRKRIAFIYSYNEKWIGGTYYIQNILHSFNSLADAQKPEVTLLYANQSDVDSVQNNNYPYIHFEKIHHHSFILLRIIRRIVRTLFKINLFLPYLKNKKITNGYFDIIFPASIIFNKKIAKKDIYWIPDFQEKYLPHFFSDSDLSYRAKWQQNIANSGETVVFSSFDAQNDFKKYFSNSNVNQKVVQFAVTHPYINNIDFDSVKKKYQIPNNYFFCTNQFFVHKNHKVVLEAVKICRDKHHEIHVIFSGKNEDYRNPNYFIELLQFVNENKLNAYVAFLGFLPRSEQLMILKNSIAIIQPSLFEGWSTVIEDCKAQNKQVICSDIKVHHEQLGDDAYYFNPKDATVLSNILMQFKSKEIFYKYENHIKKFASDFITLI